MSHISSQLTAGTSRLPPAERACAGGGGGAASSAPGPQRTMALIRTASRAVREAVSLTERNTQAPSLADDAPDKVSAPSGAVSTVSRCYLIDTPRVMVRRAFALRSRTRIPLPNL